MSDDNGHKATEDEHWSEMLGLPDDYSPAERAYDISKASTEVTKFKIRYIGEDKAKVTIVRERWQDRDHREYGDNDKSDPFNNVDEEN